MYFKTFITIILGISFGSSWPNTKGNDQIKDERVSLDKIRLSKAKVVNYLISYTERRYL